MTNYTPVPIWKYTYQFANVFTNHYYTNETLLVTATIAPPVGKSYLYPAVTNYLITYVPQIAGDFFVLPMFNFGSFNWNHSGPTNVCPLDIDSVVLTNVLVTTNYLSTSITNLPVATNTVITTSTNNTTQYTVSVFTNYQYIIHPVTCSAITNATGLYQGIENIKFVRADYDSLLGQYWQPVTNNYTMVYVTNSQSQLQHFQRILTVPDILLTAADLAGGPGDIPGVPYDDRNLNFDATNALARLAGPGTITTPTMITYDKVGPVYFDTPASVMTGKPYFTETPGGDVADLFYAEYFIWATFDGTTNAPVLYPNGTSMDNGNLYQVTVSPASLPNGKMGVNYPLVTITATGGAFTAPYAWSATGLPGGLSLTNDGKLGGKPTASGIYAFTLIMTDSVGRSVQWNYSIIIQ
jgi:hypothetical protein